MFANRSTVALGVRRVRTHVAVALAFVVLAGVTFVASPAGGMGDSDLDPGTPVPHLPSEVTVSGLPGYSTGLHGWTWSGDPTSVGTYPPTKPHSPPIVNIDSSGLIQVAGPGGTPTLATYCTELSESTTIGYGYDLGNWSVTTNGGYVSWILANYYPQQPALPAGLTDTQRAEAVQAAIWFFTDNFVLDHPTLTPHHELFDAVKAIVDAALVAGPLPAPTPADVELTPTAMSGTTADVVGPITLSVTGATGALSAAVTVTGGTMYSDASGLVPIVDGATLPTGSEIYVRSSAAGTVGLRAVAEVTVPGGSAYVYNGNISGVTSAQNLILATTSAVEVSGTASLTFTPPPTTSTSTTSTPTTSTSTTSTSTPPTSVVPPVPTTVAPTTTVPSAIKPSSDARGATGVAGNSAASRINFAG